MVTAIHKMLTLSPFSWNPSLSCLFFSYWLCACVWIYIGWISFLQLIFSILVFLSSKECFSFGLQLSSFLFPIDWFSLIYTALIPHPSPDKFANSIKTVLYLYPPPNWSNGLGFYSGTGRFQKAVFNILLHVDSVMAYLRKLSAGRLSLFLSLKCNRLFSSWASLVNSKA